MSDWFSNIIDKSILQDNLTFVSLYIAIYEHMTDYVVSNLKFYLCHWEIKDGKEHYIETDNYKNNIINRPVDDKGNKDITKASFLWLIDNGAITQKDYQRFLDAKSLRNKFAHELTTVMYRGINETEIKLFFDMFAIYKKISKWYFINFEAVFMGDELPENADLSQVQTAANVIFDMIIDVLYNGKSEEYKQMLDTIKKDGLWSEKNYTDFVNEHRSNGNVLKNDVLTIGVDGCKNAWIAAVIDRGEWRIEKFPKIDDIVGRYKQFDEFLIDMPIGLPSNVSHVRPDSVARALIPGRTSTIFAVPSRQAVYAETKDEQISENLKALGKSLASQTMAIIPKIREVDEFLCKNPEYKNVIKESHPEVCFARLNGRVLMSKKSKEDGLVERVSILQKYLPDLTVRSIQDMARQYRCNADDIVDAICLAVTGNLNVQEMAESIPAEPMKDDEGIIMQMVIPQKK